MIESNSEELDTVSRKLLKDNKKTPDWLFIHNMAVPQSIQQMQMYKDSLESFCKKCL